MADVPITNEALCSTFITALLLTGSAEEAEAAVMEGIRVMERSNASRAALLRGTIAASIATRIPKQGVAPQKHTASLLPGELRRVLGLSQEFRRCFVLRVLVGLSREVCARMLETEIHQIDEIVCASARELACLSEQGASAQPQLPASTKTGFAEKTMNNSIMRRDDSQRSSL